MFKKYNKQTIKTALNIAVPAIIESFFGAFVGLVDSYMVSSLGSVAVAAVQIAETEQARLCKVSIPQWERLSAKPFI